MTKDNKNRKHSEETKLKIRKKIQEKWESQEYREKQKSSLTGRKLTPEHRQNISLGLKGIKRTEETKQKMSDYQSNRPKEVQNKMAKSRAKWWNSLSDVEKRKMMEPIWEKAHTEKTYEKISNSLKEYCKDANVRERLSTQTKQQFEDMTVDEKYAFLKPWIIAGQKASSFESSNTAIELKVEKQLVELKVKYEKQVYINDEERGYILDFYLPEHKLVIECNGDYWHTLPSTMLRDKKLKKYIESMDEKIVFLWEKDIYNDGKIVEHCLERCMQ